MKGDNSMITIVIADDQALIRQGLRTIIDMEDDMKVVGLATNGIEACELVSSLHPDLVMMDIQMPEMDGIEAIKRIKAGASKTHILILSTFLEEHYIVEGIANGASGYMLKDMEGDRMLAAIRDTVLGKFILPSAVAAKLAKKISQTAMQQTAIATDKRLIKLTDRERDIAKLMVKGYSNRDIAAELYISEGTVRNYISNIYSKIGIIDRIQAIVHLRELI